VTALVSTTFAVAGWPVHARVGGPPSEQAPVVLVHGIGVSSRYLVPTGELLAEDRQVYAVDLPGFGRTPGPPQALDVRGLAGALRAFIREAVPGRPVLVANSFGCQVSVEVAARDPQLARALVLVGPTMDRRARTVPRQVVRWLANAPREPVSLGLILLLDYLQCGLRRPWRTFMAALADPVEDKVAAVTVPTLVIRGGNDPIASRRRVEELAAGLPDSQVHEVPGAAHTLNYSAPGPLVERVRDFLTQLPAAC
jgi:pimeloyl-ACP methyl ester carboxylesterase